MNSPSAAYFDQLAFQYDQTFTYSRVGSLHRQRVWAYLDVILGQLGGRQVLELNCGTGEDAALLSRKGFSVVATDSSPAMLQMTREKLHRLAMTDRVRVERLDMNSIEDFRPDRRFDLIFSNFGGFNCLSPDSLRRMFSALPGLLNPGGLLVAVVMPSFCLWESLYFFTRGKWKDVFRRVGGRAVAGQDSNSVSIWYHNPKVIAAAIGKGMVVRQVRPIGIFLPPSWLDPHFVRRPSTLRTLNSLEMRTHSPWLARLSDHYLIEAMRT
jgi:SAM-dependent methyltransferase